MKTANSAHLSPEHLLDGLNPQQIEAVRHGNGPLLILAGAGSGKTRVITHRIAWLISQRGVRPGQILAITFTNKAANEMLHRVDQLIGAASQSMWIGTFHSMMARILRRFADRLGIDRSFSIVDADDQQRLIKACVRDLGLDEKQFDARGVQSQISGAKNELKDVATFSREAGNDFRLSKIARVYEVYQNRLRQSNSLDFDDLLFEAVILLRTWPQVREEYQTRFQHILIDEYQDTNLAQYEIVRLLAAAHQNLCVVGDDDQSIYSFRGANIRNILDFEKDFPNCKVIKLEQNYRSTGTVLKAANAVIGLNRGRKAKKLWTAAPAGEKIVFLRAETQHEEGRFIATEIRRRMSAHPWLQFRDFALLYRLNALSRGLEQTLREDGIPYRVYGGVRFYDRKEIKDMLAYLRLTVTSADDISLGRVINVPRRGIGDVTLEALTTVARQHAVSQLEICAEADRYPELQRAAPKLQRFARLIARLRDELQNGERTLAEYLEWVQMETGLLQELLDQQNKSAGSEAVDRIENLRELLSDALEFASAEQERARQILASGVDDLSLPDEPALAETDLPGLLRAFLERASLYASTDEATGADACHLMTIHAAKGLEFDTVFLVGAEEGLFPGYRSMGSEKDLEEERRLAYVAITRARQKLYTTTTRVRLVFGQTQSFAVSRFIREIPAECVEEIGGPRGDELRGGELRGGELRGLPGQPRTKGFLGTGLPGLSTGLGGFSRAAPPPKSTAPLPNFMEGDRVSHARFGPGIIISTQPIANDAILVIQFKEAGVKRLMARMANLTLLE